MVQLYENRSRSHLTAMTRHYLGFLFLALVMLDVGADDAETDVAALDSATPPTAAETDAAILALAALKKKHAGSNKKIFEAYNRFHDTKHSGGEQALGMQEIRSLLKDLGIGNYALRTPISELTISLLDSDGDGRVSEPELSVALDVVDCWLGALEDDDADTAAILVPSARLRAALDLFAIKPSYDVFANTVRQELHSCSGPVQGWWDSWSVRLSELEREGRARLPELTRVVDVPACAAQLPARLLVPPSPSGSYSAERATLEAASRKALRSGLKRLGVKSMVAQQAAAMALLAALDDDGNGKLGAEEIEPLSRLLCATYAAVSARASDSVVAFVRALTLPEGFSPDLFAEALHAFESDAATSRSAHGLLSASTASAASTAIRESATCERETPRCSKPHPRSRHRLHLR